MLNCKVCNKEFLPNHHNEKRCPDCIELDLMLCKKHNNVYTRIKKCIYCIIEKSRIKFNETNPDDWIECPLCGYRGIELSSHIINHHNMSVDEFKEKTGIDKTKCKNKCDKMKFDKNPGWKHGGKFSPFSQNFIYADTTNITELYKQVNKTRKENNNDTTKIEYWLKKTNGDLEKAQKMLSERQKERYRRENEKEI